MNSKPTMIAVFIGLIIFAPLMFYLKGIPIIYAFILTAIVGLFFIFASIKEKKDDKKAKSFKHSVMDESYFNSAEWREKYLSRVTEDFFEKPDKKRNESRFNKALSQNGVNSLYAFWNFNDSWFLLCFLC